MTHGIHESLIQMAVDIETLLPLESNPRRGDVGAIMASYREFGQIKPIVVRPNDDGTATVIAGNHQLEAAKRLGWDKIAAVSFAVDGERAIAFALADNRTMELGYTEPELLNEVILELADIYPELINGLGWDEFYTAEIEQKLIREDNRVIEPGAGFISPTITGSSDNGFTVVGKFDSYDGYDNYGENKTSTNAAPAAPELDRNMVNVTQTEDGKQHIEIRSGFDQNDAVKRGSTTVSPGSAPRAVVQCTIVFDDTSQQARWYEFLKWIKSDPAVVGATTAEKLIDFINQHIEV
jgi:ParB family chromosome partitioning protein